MKTLVCLIAVLVITAPVLATTVTIVGDTSVPGELTLKYYVLPDTDALRGIALTLNSGVATANAAGTTAGENWNVCLDYAYDRMTAEPPESYGLGEGTPLAKDDGPGVPVGDVSDFSICVGYVDEGGLQGGVLPGSSGAPEDLCTIVLTGLPATVTVAADTLRGGAVGSPVEIILDMNNNGTLADTIVVPGVVTDCLKSDAPEYNDWLGSAGDPPVPGAQWTKPDCWCYQRQCKGDALGAPAPGSDPPLWVTSSDLDVLRDAFNDTPANMSGPGAICADFNHAAAPGSDPPLFVTSSDLDILRENFNDTGIPVCDDTNINFWTN